MRRLKIILGSTLVAIGALAGMTIEEFTPYEFESLSAAREGATKLINGGRIHVLELEDSNALVLEVWGSGLPTLALITYLPDEDGWRREEIWRPESNERFDLEQTKGQIFAIGRETHKRWKIYNPDDKS